GRGPVRLARDRHGPRRLRRAMTASAPIVPVGAMPSPGSDGAAVVAALGTAGVAVVSRAFVEDDEGALERALGSDEVLTVVLAGGGGPGGRHRRPGAPRRAGGRRVLHQRAPRAPPE